MKGKWDLKRLGFNISALVDLGQEVTSMETELSEGVKILAIADAFDAMTTNRPYRGKTFIVRSGDRN